MKQIFLFLIFFMISCNNQEIYFSSEKIDKLAEGDFSLPSPYFSIYLFVKLDNGEICKTNIDALYYVYEKFYVSDYSKFNLFLYDVLNQKKKLNKTNFSHIDIEYFEIDDEIKSKYKNLNFKDFKDFYCENKDSKEFILKQDIYNSYSIEKLNSVFFYLFINDYQITLDDNIGQYKIRPFLGDNY